MNSLKVLAVAASALMLPANATISQPRTMPDKTALFVSAVRFNNELGRREGWIVQLDPSGKVVGAVSVPGEPFCLHFDGESVLAAVNRFNSSGRSVLHADRSLCRIDRSGTIRWMGAMPGYFMAIGSSGSGSVVVLEGRSPRILAMDPDGMNVRTVYTFETTGLWLRNASLAVIGSHRLVFGADTMACPSPAPAGIWLKQSLGPDTRPERVFANSGRVGGQTGSSVWAVTQTYGTGTTVHVLDRQGVIRSLALPVGAPHPVGVGFGPDRRVYVATRASTLRDPTWLNEAMAHGWTDVFVGEMQGPARPMRRAFRLLTTYAQGFAVGDRLPWPEYRGPAL